MSFVWFGLRFIAHNGSGVCRANSGDLRKQSRKAGAGIARWSFGITPCYAQSIIFKNSKLFEIRKERPTGYTRAVDAQAQDRECEAQRDCSDCASTVRAMCSGGFAGDFLSKRQRKSSGNQTCTHHRNRHGI